MSRGSSLLDQAIEAHGGLDRWNSFEKVEADITGGGGFIRFKGLPAVSPRHATIWLHEQRATLVSTDGTGPLIVFTPARVAVEQSNGAILAERMSPRASFAGHQMNTPWDPLHLAYFSGEAFSTYFKTPFFLSDEGVEVEEIETWSDGSKPWRVLRATFPERVETHSRVQHFYFDEDLMLRRHDYQVDIAGGFGAAQLVNEPTEANGILLPSKRRAYARTPDGQPLLDLLMVSIDVSNVKFS